MVSQALTKEKADKLGLDCRTGETSREERMWISQLCSEAILSGTAGVWTEKTVCSWSWKPVGGRATDTQLMNEGGGRRGLCW